MSAGVVLGRKEVVKSPSKCLLVKKRLRSLMDSFMDDARVDEADASGIGVGWIVWDRGWLRGRIGRGASGAGEQVLEEETEKSVRK